RRVWARGLLTQDGLHLTSRAHTESPVADVPAKLHLASFLSAQPSPLPRGGHLWNPWRPTIRGTPLDRERRRRSLCQSVPTPEPLLSTICVAPSTACPPPPAGRCWKACRRTRA